MKALPESHGDDDWLHRFELLSERLAEHRPLWRERAFHQPRLSWGERHPELLAAVDALDLASAERLQSDIPAAVAWMERWLPGIGALTALCDIPATNSTLVLSESLARDLPGRKRSQIEAFAAAVVDHHLPVLDWCAGKGHLGRSISACWGGRETHGLEWQAELVAAGNLLAERHTLPVKLHHCDVLHSGTPAYLDTLFSGRRLHALALHACGDLHLQLLRSVESAGIAALASSPCCYHLTARPVYQPLSQAGRRADLQLDRDQLRSAVQETVTAPAGARRRRSRMQQWRLGFDLLQRDVRQVDDYLAVPTLPAEWGRADFATFCRQVAQLKRLELPAGIDWTRYEAAGEQRFRLVTARDVVRMLFRRPLELWLVLDQLLYLREHDFTATLQQFCVRKMTPRNLLLQAWRK